jgi:hypothetical protein
MIMSSDHEFHCLVDFPLRPHLDVNGVAYMLRVQPLEFVLPVVIPFLYLFTDLLQFFNKPRRRQKIIEVSEM